MGGKHDGSRMIVACESTLTPAHACVALGASLKGRIIEPLLKIVARMRSSALTLAVVAKHVVGVLFLVTVQ